MTYPLRSIITQGRYRPNSILVRELTAKSGSSKRLSAMRPDWQKDRSRVRSFSLTQLEAIVTVLIYDVFEWHKSATQMLNSIDGMCGHGLSELIKFSFHCLSILSEPIFRGAPFRFKKFFNEQIKGVDWYILIITSSAEPKVGTLIFGTSSWIGQPLCLF